MAKQTINIGTTPNDGTGDALRNAFDKTNSNFTELYDDKQDELVSGTNIKSINGNSLLGSGDLVVGGSSGVFGISNSSGVYTYYATLTIAMAAAISGQTIQMFTNVTETGAVQINLKNGVNINFNGNTYTLNNAGTSNCFSDNNSSVSCKLINGKVIRSGGTNSESNSCSLYIDNSSSILECIGMKFESTFGHACVNEGTVYGGEYFGNTGFYVRNGIAYNITATSNSNLGLRVVSSRCVNCIGISSASHGITINTGTLENCYGVSTGGGGYGLNSQTCLALNCSFFSSSSFGAGAVSGTNDFANCSFRSTSSAAFYAQAIANLDNCSAYSTASHGFWAFNAVSYLRNCSGYSTANNGIRAGSLVELHNCTAQSTAASALHTANKVYSSNALSTWNNAAGHAITGDTTAYNEIFNSTLQVTNASANCLHYGSAINVRFGANIFKGATTQINANVTQAQTILPDLYGNIKIG
jgi:hypothetical protein